MDGDIWRRDQVGCSESGEQFSVDAQMVVSNPVWMLGDQGVVQGGSSQSGEQTIVRAHRAVSSP